MIKGIVSSYFCKKFALSFLYVINMDTGEWQVCICNPNYEIQVEYPNRLRNKETKQLVREWIGKGKYGRGYVLVHLGNKKLLKHRIVAQQFLENPDKLPQVDHRNGIRTDNHISNLRWCSRSTNLKNRNSCGGKPFVYLEQLPDTAEPLESYNNHEFQDLYLDKNNSKLYLDNGARIREIEPVNGYYNVLDKEGNRFRINEQIYNDN